MKRAEPEVIGAAFFKFHEASDHINNINAAEYLLYRILRYHGLLISERMTYFQLFIYNFKP
jgi:hypothetical protein